MSLLVVIVKPFSSVFGAFISWLADTRFAQKGITHLFNYLLITISLLHFYLWLHQGQYIYFIYERSFLADPIYPTAFRVIYFKQSQNTLKVVVVVVVVVSSSSSDYLFILIFFSPFFKFLVAFFYHNLLSLGLSFNNIEEWCRLTLICAVVSFHRMRILLRFHIKASKKF